MNEYEGVGYYEDGDGKRYRDAALWKMADEQKYESLDPEKVLESLFPEEREAFRMILDAYRRVRDADISFPIILAPDGCLADGYHRLVRAFAEGHSVIRVVRLQKMPSPM